MKYAKVLSKLLLLATILLGTERFHCYASTIEIQTPFAGSTVEVVPGQQLTVPLLVHNSGSDVVGFYSIQPTLTIDGGSSFASIDSITPATDPFFSPTNPFLITVNGKASVSDGSIQLTPLSGMTTASVVSINLTISTEATGTLHLLMEPFDPIKADASVYFTRSADPPFAVPMEFSNPVLEQFDGRSLLLDIVVNSPLPGDYDQNGFVDAADYTDWKSSFGSFVTPGSGADGNGDGTVDAADYIIWRNQLGAGISPSAVSAPNFSGTQVSEPSSCISPLMIIVFSHLFRRNIRLRGD